MNEGAKCRGQVQSGRKKIKEEGRGNSNKANGKPHNWLGPKGKERKVSKQSGT